MRRSEEGCVTQPAAVVKRNEMHRSEEGCVTKPAAVFDSMGNPQCYKTCTKCDSVLHRSTASTCTRCDSVLHGSTDSSSFCDKNNHILALASLRPPTPMNVSWVCTDTVHYILCTILLYTISILYLYMHTIRYIVSDALASSWGRDAGLTYPPIFQDPLNDSCPHIQCYPHMQCCFNIFASTTLPLRLHPLRMHLCTSRYSLL